MRYPIAIEPRTETSEYGVVIPDLPGCFSAGDILEEALAGAEEAGLAWIDAALDAGEAVPPPSSLEAVRANPEFSGWILSLVTIDPAALDDTVERVNITLPRRILRRLDDEARVAGETRSGYIAKLAIGRGSR
ncbi:MAG TPA: type II toxin-antitoxin system HicB family antitoxin [Roseiarcus sp.]|nr:type II toxin-antitoxin system HicB family antitoxin [Roseiarcus sp.]